MPPPALMIWDDFDALGCGFSGQPDVRVMPHRLAAVGWKPKPRQDRRPDFGMVGAEYPLFGDVGGNRLVFLGR